MPSPHFTKGRPCKVETLVIHYISCINTNPDDPFNTTSCLKLLCEPIIQEGQKPVKVSAHYMIDRQGEIYSLVNEEDTAWHAGASSLRGKSVKNSCNAFSIGIELVGTNSDKFTEEQYKALSNLAGEIIDRHDILSENIVGHCHIAPGRKIDPGAMFDWDRFYKELYSDTAVLFETHQPETKLETKTEIITDGKEISWWEKVLNWISKIFA
jgi:AmpD protein